MRRTNRQNSQLFCEIVKSAKILGVSKGDDLKWHEHVEKISAEASQRIYLLRQLKSAGIDRISLIQFYCASIRFVWKYASQAFHFILPVYLSDQIERVQKRVLRIMHPELSYRKALEDTKIFKGPRTPGYFAKFFANPVHVTRFRIILELK